MRRYNIVSAKVYEKNGEQKKSWKQVGTLIRWEANGDKPEQFSVELNMCPDVKYYVFEEKPRGESSAPASEDVQW